MIIEKSKIELLTQKISEYVNGKIISKELDVTDENSWISKIDVILENTLITYTKEEVERCEFLTYFIELEYLKNREIHIAYYQSNIKVIEIILRIKDDFEKYEICNNVQVIVNERELKI